MLAYPAAFTPDEELGGFTVTFRDVPEAVTEGDTFDEAMLHASDALESGLAFYVSEHQPVPVPSAPEPGEHLVLLSSLGMARLGLYTAMRERGVSRVDLARRLNVPLDHVEKLLDLRRPGKMEPLETALAALGKRLVIEVADAA